MNVLFVRLHNAGRSQISEALFTARSTGEDAAVRNAASDARFLALSLIRERFRRVAQALELDGASSRLVSLPTPDLDDEALLHPAAVVGRDPVVEPGEGVPEGSCGDGQRDGSSLPTHENDFDGDRHDVTMLLDRPRWALGRGCHGN